MIRNKKMYKVAILLSTFNGDKFILKQLESLKNQKSVYIKLFIIDDKSDDKTLDIVKKFKIPKKIFKSKNFRDPVRNFIYLTQNIKTRFDYYAFCDQDDFWKDYKLIYSIQNLKKKNADVLGCRTIYTNENLIPYGISTNFKKKLTFKNSLVQSVMGGNTLIWTNNFQNKLNKLGYCRPASHDWMVYQLATILKLKIVYISKPLVLYRQHAKNVVGANLGLKNILKRIFWGIKGRYSYWHELNRSHLFKAVKLFNVDKNLKRDLIFFYNTRKIKNPIKRIINIFFILKIYRQTIFGNILLFFAVLLGKI